MLGEGFVQGTTCARSKPGDVRAEEERFPLQRDLGLLYKWLELRRYVCYSGRHTGPGEEEYGGIREVRRQFGYCLRGVSDDLRETQ